MKIIKFDKCVYFEIPTSHHYANGCPLSFKQSRSIYHLRAFSNPKENMSHWHKWSEFQCMLSIPRYGQMILIEGYKAYMKSEVVFLLFF